MPTHYIGLMSGTSADGVDAVCVEFGESPPCVTIAAHEYERYSDTLRERLIALMTPGPDEIDRMGALEGELAEIFARAAARVCQKAGLAATAIAAIGSHGQTVRHRPGGDFGFTLQIGDPARIAERTGIQTVADFRRRDIAAGGQGAPLVPAFHAWLFGQSAQTRAIINIGGISNVTLLPAKNGAASPYGFDTGPGNALLDAWAHATQGLAQDTDGRLAAQGHTHPGLLALLLEDPYFAAPPPKSTGREHFTLAWLQNGLKRLGKSISAADVQATLVALTAETIAAALHLMTPDAVFVCGGGTANPVLMAALQLQMKAPVHTTAVLGLNPQLVEPVAFAWLARQTLHNKPGNIPSATGARHPVVLGAVYPA